MAGDTIPGNMYYVAGDGLAVWPIPPFLAERTRVSGQQPYFWRR